MVKLYDLLDSIPPSVKVDIHYYKDKNNSTEEVKVFVVRLLDYERNENTQKYDNCYAVVSPTITYCGIKAYPYEWLNIAIMYNEKE